jgi:hypothetical protein
MAWLVLLGEIGFLRDATRQLLILARSHGQAIKVSGATGRPFFFGISLEMPGAARRRRSPAQPYVARFIGCQCSCLPFLPNLGRNCPRSQRPVEAKRARPWEAVRSTFFPKMADGRRQPTRRRRPSQLLEVNHAHCVPFLPKLGRNYPRSRGLESRPDGSRWLEQRAHHLFQKCFPEMAAGRGVPRQTARSLTDSSSRTLIAFRFCPIWAEIIHTRSDLVSRPDGSRHLKQRANHLFCNLAQKRLLVHRDEAIARRPIHWVAKCS